MDKPKVKDSQYFRNFSAIIVLFNFCMVIFVISFFYFQERSLLKANSIKNGQVLLDSKELMIQKMYDKYETLLYAVRESSFFHAYMTKVNNETSADLRELFRALTMHDENITQLRFLSADGSEKIRVDRVSLRGDIKVFGDDELQNKQHRYYFTEAMKLSPGEVYFSKLDLNIEHGVLEKPYKPVLRIAIPVFDENVTAGILIVNLFTKSMLEMLVSSEEYFCYIYDADGYLLYSNDHLMENWGRYTGGHPLMKKINLLLKRPITIGSNQESLFFGIRSQYPEIMLSSLPGKFAGISVILLTLSLILSYIISRHPMRLLANLQRQHKTLLQQSKNATIGEILTSISHHWRQPLNEISLSAQMIREVCHENSYSAPHVDLDEVFTLQQDRIQYLSKTIEIFKENKNNTQIDSQKIKAVDEILESVSLIRSMMVEYDISLKLLCSCNENEAVCTLDKIDGYCNIGRDYIYGPKEDFRQAILSILINIKESMVAQNKPSKHIDIVVDAKADDIRCTIKSTMGLDRKFLSEMLDPYSSAKTTDNVISMGLYIAKTIIEKRFNGKFFIESSANSSAFYINIPKYKEKAADSK